jgi:anion-transporting  ArsA/GET3 family ATPase
MEQGFRDRATNVDALLKDERTAFVVIAAPRREAVTEAIYFAERLRESTSRVEALIINRMFPSYGPVPPGLTAVDEPDGGLAALIGNLRDLGGVNAQEALQVAILSDRLPEAPITRVPYLADDVHDLDGLDQVAGWLFGRSS